MNKYTFLVTAALMSRLIVSAPLYASAQVADTVATEDLEGVVVTGSRVAMSLKTSSRMVTVLDSAAIRSAAVHTVNDILKFVIGVDVRQRGEMGMQTDIGIRGSTQDQIAVLLNGINICDPQTGHNAADFPVDMNQIARIEVLEGPAARVYGSSSLVGAINIVTKTPENNEVSAHLDGGSYGFASAGASAGLAKGSFKSSVSASYTRSDGYLRNSTGSLNSDFKAVKAFLQGSYGSAPADIRWHAGVSSRDFGANTFYSSKFDDQFEHTLKIYAAVGAETKGRFRFKPAAYWNQGLDRFELVRGNAAAVPFNHHKTNVLGLNLNSEYDWRFGTLSFGVELRNEGIISTNLGEPLASSHKVSGWEAEYVKGLNRTNISLFLENSLVLDRLTFSAGLSAIRNTGNDVPFRLYPGADVSYRLSESWKAYASYNSSLRMPTFTELYYSVGGFMADKNLKAEEMQSVEAGLKYLRSGIRAVFSLYYNIGTNNIDWVRTIEPEGDWKSVNYSKIYTFGQEASVSLDFRRLFRRSRMFVTGVNLGYGHISMDKKLEENIQSRSVLEYLRHKVAAQVTLCPYEGWTLSASYRYHDRNNGLKPYSLFDAKLVWDARKWLSIYAETSNIFNLTYFDYGDIPQIGRSIRAGVILELCAAK